MLQRIQLSIDPYFRRDKSYSSGMGSSLVSSPPSPSSLSQSSSLGSPSPSDILASPDPDWRLFYVLGLFEFSSEDPDHLPFQKGDILEIVQQEKSGWWAALCEGRIGWIPSAFVVRVDDEHAGKLHKIRRDRRVCQYEVDSMYNSAPTTAMTRSATLPIRISAAPEYRIDLRDNLMHYTDPGKLVSPITPYFGLNNSLHSFRCRRFAFCLCPALPETHLVIIVSHSRMPSHTLLIKPWWTILQTLRRNTH